MPNIKSESETSEPELKRHVIITDNHHIVHYNES
jgi:hypothetical protein